MGSVLNQEAECITRTYSWWINIYTAWSSRLIYCLRPIPNCAATTDTTNPVSKKLPWHFQPMIRLTTPLRLLLGNTQPNLKFPDYHKKPAENCPKGDAHTWEAKQPFPVTLFFHPTGYPSVLKQATRSSAMGKSPTYTRRAFRIPRFSQRFT